MTAGSGSFENVITNYGSAVWSAQVFITAQSSNAPVCYERIQFPIQWIHLCHIRVFFTCIVHGFLAIVFVSTFETKEIVQ